MRISILPINNIHKQNISKPGVDKRTNLSSKPDSFEKTISFSRRLPIEEVEELFQRTHQAFLDEQNIRKRHHIKNSFSQRFKEIKRREVIESSSEIIEDCFHEIGNILQTVLVTFSSESRGGKNLDNNNRLFKVTGDSVIETLRRYDLFLSKSDSNISPTDAFELALNYAQGQASPRGINIQVTGQEALAKNVEAINVDSYEIYSVFSNLVQNAVKYSPDNSSIGVKFEEKVIKGKKHLVCSVSDEGIGIPKEEQSKVLRGQRASNAKESSIQGSGYGLKRVAKIIRLADSELQITSPVDPKNLEYPGTKMSFAIEITE